jgi:hypothetical protein
MGDSLPADPQDDLTLAENVYVKVSTSALTEQHQPTASFAKALAWVCSDCLLG